MTTSTNGNGNLIDEFEEAFQQCLCLFNKDEGIENNDYGLSSNRDETKIEVDQVTLRFIDLARQVEAFFLQKRFLLSALKPELIIKEDVTDLKIELLRKEDLIKRHQDKITVWQNLLAEMHGWVQPNVLTNSGQGFQTQGTNSGNVSSMHLLQHQQTQQTNLQQYQIQQQLHHQMQHGSISSTSMNSPGQGVSIGPQNVFMNQGNISTRSPSFQLGMNSPLQGPLAFLEKTTSNIGMPDRRS